MVLLIIIPIKWLFHWEYTLFSDKPRWRWRCFEHCSVMSTTQNHWDFLNVCDVFILFWNGLCRYATDTGVKSNFVKLLAGLCCVLLSSWDHDLSWLKYIEMNSFGSLSHVQISSKLWKCNVLATLQPRFRKIGGWHYIHFRSFWYSTWQREVLKFLGKHGAVI